MLPFAKVVGILQPPPARTRMTGKGGNAYHWRWTLGTQVSLHKTFLNHPYLLSSAPSHLVFCNHFSTMYYFLLKWYISSQV